MAHYKLERVADPDILALYAPFMPDGYILFKDKYYMYMAYQNRFTKAFYNATWVRFDFCDRSITYPIYTREYYEIENTPEIDRWYDTVDYQ